MSKHNYSQYSKKNENVAPVAVEDEVTTPEVDVETVVDTVVAPEVKMEVELSETTAAPELVNETVETAAIPETVKGIVANCAKLNVRVAPNASATIACVLDAKSEIEIDMAKSTDEWFCVCTVAGTEGYCMRKFVNAYL